MGNAKPKGTIYIATHRAEIQQRQKTAKKKATRAAAKNSKSNLKKQDGGGFDMRGNLIAPATLADKGGNSESNTGSQKTDPPGDLSMEGTETELSNMAAENRPKEQQESAPPTHPIVPPDTEQSEQQPTATFEGRPIIKAAPESMMGQKKGRGLKRQGAIRVKNGGVRARREQRKRRAQKGEEEQMGQEKRTRISPTFAQQPKNGGRVLRSAGLGGMRRV